MRAVSSRVWSLGRRNVIREDGKQGRIWFFAHVISSELGCQIKNKGILGWGFVEDHAQTIGYDV